MSKKARDKGDLQAFLRHARTVTYPMIKGSNFTVSLMPRDPDPKYCLELGASIMFNKPIIVVVTDDGLMVPDALRRIADAIVFGNPAKDPAAWERLEKAIKDVQANIKRGNA